ncbi:MAG: HAD family hydrolase [Candidatus Binatia bacterium]
MELDGILFDYGGTLDGPASHWLDRFVALYAAAGAPLPIERLKPAFYAADDAAYADPAVAAMSLDELMAFHVGVQHDRLGIDDAALRRRLVEAFVAGTQAALADSRAVLARLATRYRLGVVSNFYGNVARILADAGFGPLLTTVADSNVVGAMKPDRRIFDHALAALGTAPARTLHAGDSLPARRPRRPRPRPAHRLAGARRARHRQRPRRRPGDHVAARARIPLHRRGAERGDGADGLRVSAPRR